MVLNQSFVSSVFAPSLSQVSFRMNVASLCVSKIAETSSSLSGLELADNHTGTIIEVLVVETPCEVYEGDLVTLVDSLSLLSSFFSGELRFW